MTTLIGRINGRYSGANWTPIRYVNRAYSRTVLAGLYRLADVALVTPLRDGMNLVAKEFVAAQSGKSRRPGAVGIRRRIGRVGSALIVNPHESEAVAAALKQVLEMPLEDRRLRHTPMLEHLLKYDIDHWTEAFLTALGETRQRPSLLENLRRRSSRPLKPVAY